METKAVFEIVIKENGEVVFNRLGAAAGKLDDHHKKLKKSTGELNEAFSGLTRRVTELVGAYAGLEALKASFDAYKEEKLALVDLNGVYENNKKYTKETMDGMEQLADSQEKTTGIYKSQTEALEKNLLAHRDIKVSYAQIIPAIEDFAKGKGLDVGSAGELFIKALGNPMRAQLALKEAGIDLTKEQSKQMIQLYETGHAAEYQAFMVNALESRWHGLAAQKFDADPEEQLAVAFHEAQVELGHFEEELLVDLMPTLKSVAAGFQIVVKWLEQHKGLVEGTAKVVGVLITGLILYNATVKAAAALDFLFGTSLASMTVGLEAATVAEGEAAEGMTALDAVMDANPIGLVVLAVGALVLAFKELGDMAQAAEDKYEHAVNAMNKNVNAPAIEMYKKGSEADKNALRMEVERDLRDKIAKSQKLQDEVKNSFFVNQGAAIEKAHTLYRQIDQDAQLLKQFKAADSPTLKNSKPVKVSAAGDVSIASPDSLKGEKQIVNTWNIKDFGRITLTTTSGKEAAGDIHSQIMGALLTAVNDSEIASGQ